MEIAVGTAANPEVSKPGKMFTASGTAAEVVEDRPSFNELQSIERHRREILLRVSSFNIAACLCTFVMHLTTRNICNAMLHTSHHDIIYTFY